MIKETILFAIDAYQVTTLLLIATQDTINEFQRGSVNGLNRVIFKLVMTTQ